MSGRLYPDTVCHVTPQQNPRPLGGYFASNTNDNIMITLGSCNRHTGLELKSRLGRGAVEGNLFAVLWQVINGHPA